MVLFFLYIILILVILSVANGDWLRGATTNVHFFLHQNKKISNANELQNEYGEKSENIFIISGLKNLGNTCYMNSILQSIYNIKQFREYLMKIKFKESSVGESLQHLFREMSESNHNVVTPLSFCNTIGVNPRVQEDAQEFLLRLLNQLDENIEINNNCNNTNHHTQSPSNTTSITSSVLLPSHYFYGSLQQNIDCLQVPFSKSKEMSFYDISLDIIQNNNDNKNSIEKSLQSFFQSELLIKDCQYKTKEFGLQDAKKYITIKKLPKVLFLHLKRFSFDYTTETLKKISDKVSFPLKIDLHSYYSKNITYNNNSNNNNNNNNNNNSDSSYLLRSIIIHQGTPNFGHYFCYTRPNPITQPEKWLKINDDVVTETSFQDIMEVAYGNDISTTNTSPTREAKQDTSDMKTGLLGFLRRSNQMETMTSNAYILQYSDSNTI